jgi:hypothetical protein
VRAKLVKQVAKMKAQPNAADEKKLVEFCELLDQRRVFSAPYTSEVVELCVGSLRMVQDETTRRISELEHPGAKAMLEAVQDHLRAFMDRWSGFRTPYPLGHDHDGRLTEFFRDLGVLRERVRLCTEGIALTAPKAKVLKAAENAARS